MPDVQEPAVDPMPMLGLWGWRRRVVALYAEVRAMPAPKLAWQLWREARDELFRNTLQSLMQRQRRDRFQGLPVFEYNPTLRFLVELTGVPPGAPRHTVPAGDDGTVGMVPFAMTAGLERRLGQELTLYWLEGYGGGVFLPFKDATTGDATFGGGRYILDTIKGADLGGDDRGRVVIDFNFAYNPSCAYSDRWICPLAPAENTLPAAVRAGEQIAA
ncbi:MAG: DUF1684 domain-containing protein [Geminicoccaceae bacterium]|nr:DUF1684 domain-containing protein [Geminicoccaceae bacterium]